ncbi:hypothetical protein RGF97_26675 [Streptomyces roseicoloratus]|uniref:Uncharacterized protein n=2 Tax=Streptomyces roseicoloratus TaxID=2508722 RepID=A0ABY9RZT1_9ACTN|nr:hypothetical protein [Streptomyces roseicoloratus]WMX47673.1 hypothetical protein RGF97_26675 [Streptomyces roseicoloratus]
MATVYAGAMITGFLPAGCLAVVLSRRSRPRRGGRIDLRTFRSADA